MISPSFRPKLLASCLLISLIIFGILGFRTGKSLGFFGRIKSLTFQIMSTGRAIVDQPYSRRDHQGDFTDIIFLHHSVGRGIIAQGSLRERLSKAGLSFYDQDYNSLGLTDSQGKSTGYSYWVPEDNTDPDGLSRIFQQPIYPAPINTLSGLFQHEVIMIKSCFPNSHIGSDAQLRTAQTNYRAIQSIMKEHPEKLFIVLTTPPLTPAETNPTEAERARKIADWLASEDFRDQSGNIFVFDLFNLLADDRPTSPDFNMLRAEYQNGTDSHPNQRANEVVGQKLSDFIQESIVDYGSIWKKQ